MLYQTELRRLLGRGRRNRTSANGPKMQNVSAVSFHHWTRQNTSCCHYTIPQISNCSLTGFEPAPPAFTRACFRYTKPILRSIVPTHYSPCTAFFFGIVQRQLLTLCRCFRRAGYRNRTDIISPWRGDAIPLGESRISLFRNSENRIGAGPVTSRGSSRICFHGIALTVLRPACHIL